MLGDTLEDVLDEARSYLEGEQGQTINLLAEEITDGADTVALSFATSGITVGTLLSVGLETMHVWSVDAGAKTATVRRGHSGSTRTAHVAGTLVRVSAVTNHRLLRAVNSEIDSLTGAGLFHMRALDLTVAASVRTYDLAADVVEVYEVRYDHTGTGNEWPRLTGWDVLPEALAAEFPSGHALRLNTLPPANRPMRVLYKAALSHLTALTDDVAAVTGLAASATDLPAIGAAWRIAAPSEVARNRTDRQGDPRRAEEVGPGAKLRGAIGLERMRERRIGEERDRLTTLYPMRSDT